MTSVKTHTPTTVWNYDTLLWTSSSNNWSFHSIFSVSQKFEQGYQDSPLDLTFMRLRLRWWGHHLLSHVTTDYMLLCSPLLAGTIIKLIMTSSSNPVPAGLLAWYSRRADYLSNDKSNFRRVARVAYLGTRNKSRRQADKPIAFRHSDSDLIVLNALSVLRSPGGCGGRSAISEQVQCCRGCWWSNFATLRFPIRSLCSRSKSSFLLSSRGFLSVQKKNKYHVKFW